MRTYTINIYFVGGIRQTVTFTQPTTFTSLSDLIWALANSYALTIGERVDRIVVYDPDDQRIYL